LERSSERLNGTGNLLSAYSYQGVLQRGYALVTDTGGKIVRKGKPLGTGEAVTLTFSDGPRGAVIDGKAKPKAKPKKVIEKKQGDLF